MTPSAKVLPIPEGSLVVLTDVDLGDVVGSLVPTLERAAGHDRFAVLVIATGEAVEVWGPDDDLVAKVQAALDAGKAEAGSCVVAAVDSDGVCTGCGSVHRSRFRPHLSGNLYAGPAPWDKPEPGWPGPGERLA